MRTRYKTFEDPLEPYNIYFTTSTIIEWIPIFTDEERFNIIAKSLTFCRNEKELKLYAYVIMENHLHMIVSGRELTNTLKAFKSFTSGELIKNLKNRKLDWVLNQMSYFKKQYKKESNYQVWQEGFQPKLINGREMLAQKMDYIHFNPVRRGYVERPEQWRYSSAQKILMNEKGTIEIDELEL